MTKKENLREIVLEGLLAITKKGEKFHYVLDALLNKYAYLPAADRAFITRIFHGTLEKRGWIDWVIASRSSFPFHKIKPVILEILRLSVFQLLFLDRVPPFAVCNEAQKLTAAYGFAGLKGFVNGILRSISANREKILSERSRLPLSIAYSMPEWILDKLRWASGDERTFLSVLESFEGQSPLTVRINQSLTNTQDIEKEWAKAGVFFRKVAGLEFLYMLSGFDRLGDVAGIADGRAMIQDFSSALSVYLAGIVPGNRILDLCAAPGGKSFFAADLLRGSGTVKSFDIHPDKVKSLREKMESLSFSGVELEADCRDASKRHPSLREWADVVIADVPCSGLGVIGKKPDIRYRVTQKDCSELAFLSQTILHNAAEYVKPGGILVFSTCTLSSIENEDNRTWFLKAHPDFHPVDFSSRLPSVLEGQARYRRQAEEGYLSLLPTREGMFSKKTISKTESSKEEYLKEVFSEESFSMDGFFIALFKKGGL